MINTREPKIKIIGLVVYLLVSIIMSKWVIPFYLDTTNPNSDLSFFTVTFIGQIFAFGLPLYVLVKWVRITRNHSIEKSQIYEIPNKPLINKQSLKYILWVVPVYLVVKLLSESLMLGLYYFKGSSNLAVDIQQPNAQSFFIIVLLVAIIPAIIEEITYRGLYFDTYRDDKLKYVCISTLVFMFSHSNPISICTALILSSYFSVVIIRTQSIKLVIILHFLFNLISLWVSNYVVFPLSLLSAIKNVVTPQTVLGYGLINLGLGLGIIWMTFLLKKNRHVFIRIQSSGKFGFKFKYEDLLSILLIVIAISAYIVF